MEKAKGDRIADVAGMLAVPDHRREIPDEDYLPSPMPRPKNRSWKIQSAVYLDQTDHSTKGNVTTCHWDSGLPRSLLHETMRRYKKMKITSVRQS